MGVANTPDVIADGDHHLLRQTAKTKCITEYPLFNYTPLQSVQGDGHLSRGQGGGGLRYNIHVYACSGMLLYIVQGEGV